MALRMTCGPEVQGQGLGLESKDFKHSTTILDCISSNGILAIYVIYSF